MLNIKVSIWFVIFALFLGIAASSYVSLTELRSTLRAEKQQQIKAQIDQAASVIEYHQHLVDINQLNTEEAQQRAANMIRGLRYGKEGYFWINDLNHTLIVHPFRRKLEGKSMFDFQDKEGAFVYREFVSAAQSPQAGGYLLYYRTRPGFEGNDHQIPKLSYVRRVDPWGWVIGTGLYLDDVETIIEQQIRNQISLWTVLLLALTLIGLIASIVWRKNAP